MSEEHCVICGGDIWHRFGEVYSGGTRLSGSEVLRDEQVFPIGCCSDCGHVRIMHKYDEATFSALYSIENQQPVSWGEAQKIDPLAPYVEMVELLGGSALLEQSGLILDIGCGNGYLLRTLAERFNIPLQRLLGVDFNRMLPNHFNFAQANLNTDSLASVVMSDTKIDTIICSHVIEHVKDPRHFLRQLARLLNHNQAVLYIETPDFAALDTKNADICNLIHPQHINYFTADELILLLRSMGFVVEYIDTYVTGRIPRLRCVAHLASRSRSSIPIAGTLHSGRVLRRIMAERILQSSVPPILWGCGGDLWRVIEENPVIINFLTTGRLRLADRAVAGGVLFEQTVIPPTDLASTMGEIILTPAYIGTRKSMLTYAHEQGFLSRVVDLYATALLLDQSD